jgi:hypothetical protein
MRRLRDDIFEAAEIVSISGLFCLAGQLKTS